MPTNQQTYSMDCYPSGEVVNLIDPDTETIHIYDIAHHLSIENRYCGACSRAYSVAEHSVRAAWICERVYQGDMSKAFACLMHDAHEAYCKDIHRPLKEAMKRVSEGHVTEYKQICNTVDASIMSRFGVPTCKEAVKHIDMIMLLAEAKQLMRNRGNNWHWPEGFKEQNRLHVDEVIRGMLMNPSCDWKYWFLTLFEKYYYGGASV